MTRAAAALLCVAAAASRAAAAPPDFDAAAADARALLDQLVAADTTNPPGNEARATAIGEAWLKKAGVSFDSHEFAPGRRNLVARLRGDGSAKPLLLLAHIDVVGVSGQKWSTEPHKLTEVEKYLVGRGASDDLGMAAVILEEVALLKAVPLRRDVIVAWTGDEESDGAGVKALLEQHPELIDAEIALNEGGGVRLGADGKPSFVSLGVAEKIYQDFVLRATGPTGHSSIPVPGNAIVKLARALERVGAHEFPARLLPVTRAYFAARAAVEPPDVAKAMKSLSPAALATLDKSPPLHALLHTTCVVTQVSGGTRQNALPAEAFANVNCRILPDEKPRDVHAMLVLTIADPEVEVRAVPANAVAGPSPLEGEIPTAVRKVMGEMFPGIPVIPSMGTGATDSKYLRQKGVAAYGLTPLPQSEEDNRRNHGADERIPAASLRTGVEMYYRLVVELAAKR